MQLVLKRSPALEAAVEAHIDALHDRTSPLYHQWLTAQQFGDQYGVPQADVAVVTAWLVSEGLRVDSVPVSRMFVEFSGTAGQIAKAFHTEIHRLHVRGQWHIANVTDPSIPALLADRVAGVHALHDFMPHPLFKPRGAVKRDPGTGTWSRVNTDPDFTFTQSPTTYYAVAPADFAAIYDLNALFAAGYRGAGQDVVVIEDTTLKNASDVATFRSAFGLSTDAGTFAQMTATGTTTCISAGVNGNEGEAALDAEWAGAAAPDAKIELASCADSATVFGGLIAIQNLINGATPPQVMSISYAECESDNGATGNQSYVNAYQQATAEGVSVFVAAGDGGAAECDDDADFATHGISVNGFASTPYNVAVGGTDFMDLYDSESAGPAVTNYWSATNGATFGSALSYIPEIPWNDSCASALTYGLHMFTQSYGTTGFCNSATGESDDLTTAAGSGGPSNFSAQPTWQTGAVGLPTKSGGPRYLPDVSLFAGNGAWGHFYVYCMSDTAEGGGVCNYGSASDTLAQGAGGTSFSAPALAGIEALVNQYTGSAQGNPNPTYYKLASAEFGAAGSTRCNSSEGAPASPTLPDSTCIFHDVTQGDTDVPCTGTVDCFGSGKVGSKTLNGALSTSATSFAPAYPAGIGWDFATGLGSMDAYNLVTRW
jgi:subtilase family serine protease